MEKILLFIPSYNCATQIDRVIDKVSKVDKYFKEIIFIDDHGKDETSIIIQNRIKKKKYKLIQNCQNYGLGGSHKVAFNYAIKNGFDYVVVLHGDDQADISDLIPILKSGDYKNYDSMLGSRFMKSSKIVGYSKFRIFGNIVYNKIFSIFLREKVYDLGSGLNMYKVDSLKNEYYKKYPDNLVFNYVMVMGINFYKQKVKYFPISWREEDQVSNVKMFSQAISVLKLLFSYIFNKKKFMNEEHRNKVIKSYRYNEINIK